MTIRPDPSTIMAAHAYTISSARIAAEPSMRKLWVATACSAAATLIAAAGPYSRTAKIAPAASADDHNAGATA
ncbi:hypothetical protein O4159_23820 [Gordonia terrae]|uniref:hypothetical protein n=1 Tax=Gordonia hongkongensis TaxID=1701090 RepID=UPI0022B45F02|nr:hypothetical protein [Gordonia terrae]